MGRPIAGRITLLPAHNSCLVNLPGGLCAALDSAKTLVQDVVVEIIFRDEARSAQSLSPIPTNPATRSIFAGWTGNSSQIRPSPAGISAAGRDGAANVVEIDQAFARVLGLTDGQNISIVVHPKPVLAEVVNIEPLTSADWEMIELHAQFLEINFLSQVRALPNPAFEGADKTKTKVPAHPVTLHLSPTSAVNVRVTSLTPSPGPNVPFVKIAPNSEVIVAPKARAKPIDRHRDGGSITSIGRRSVKSAASGRHRSREETVSRGPIFLRGLDAACLSLDLDEAEAGANAEQTNQAMQVWVDPDVLQSKQLRGSPWVTVSVALPTKLLESTQDDETENPAAKVVAKAVPWVSGPCPSHCALSPLLCKALSAEGAIGVLIRLEAAPASVPKPSVLKGSRDGAVKSLKIFPFAGAVSTSTSPAIHFGGQSRQEKEESSERLKRVFGKGRSAGSVFDGPISDRMILPSMPPAGDNPGWPGGLVRFDPPVAQTDSAKSAVSWFLGTDRKFSLDVQAEIAMPSSKLRLYSPGHPLPDSLPELVGVADTIQTVCDHLVYSSSVLLTGRAGAGKTDVARSVALMLQRERYFYVVFVSCKKVVSDKTSVSAIKDTLDRIFGFAAWGTRVAGRAVVVLDDIDALTPVETELQVGNENNRSRHVGETICALAKRYCREGGAVSILATAAGKDSVNAVVVGGHVVRETVVLKAPDKDGRRRILDHLSRRDPGDTKDSKGSGDSTDPSKDESAVKFGVEPDVDLLDIAGQTDGFMPADLVVLVSRARSECMIRIVGGDGLDPDASVQSLVLSTGDFRAALAGFTPASLRNVTLQKSDVDWASIGGLASTKQILLETLQYPTTYAPIFAACPLRLRSGLLLYGYPGCGKTLLASAVASQSGLNFISVKGPEILNKYIGASEKGVRDLFERAEAARPCVLFFDEFDSIAPKRGHDSTGVTDRVVNQLLTLMDGAEGLTGVYVLAATSRPDLIDSALLRPGRLDKSLLCDMPTFEDRLDIVRALSTKVKLGHDVRAPGQDLRDSRLVDVARRTDGFSGADLRAVVQDAQLAAIHDFLARDGEGEKGDSTGGVTSTLSSSSSAYPEFCYFQYKSGDGDGSAGEEDKSKLAERAVLAAKLSELQAHRQRQRLAREEQQRSLTSGLAGLGSGRHGRSFSIASSVGPDVNALAEVNGVDGSGGDHDGVERSRTGGSDEDDVDGSGQPAVCWRHFVAALDSARPSISVPERARFDGIYSAFVAGRNGEMPSGEAGNEIGGRTTLM